MRALDLCISSIESCIARRRYSLCVYYDIYVLRPPKPGRGKECRDVRTLLWLFDRLDRGMGEWEGDG